MEAVDISIMIEGQMGLTVPRWRAIVDHVERLGFAGLYRSDHFIGPSSPDEESLELVVSLASLAERTERLRFGPLVAPFSFRDPVILAWQAAALHEMSGGRYVLGVGAGWMEREHAMFGYELLDVRARAQRLEEGLEVCAGLLRDDGPVDFDGRFFRLRGATLRPRPTPPPPLCIGGNGIRRTIPLAARYADVWNGVMLPPDAFAERVAVLDQRLRAEGRAREDVRRTMMTAVYSGADGRELDARLGLLRRKQGAGDASTGELVERLRGNGVLAGTYDEVRDQIAVLAKAGAQELMLQWFWLDDLDGLARLAAELVG